jgi:hypothetical protein
MLRSKGFQPSSFKASEVHAMAKQWYEFNHKELIGKALGSLCWHHLLDQAQKLELVERRAKAQSAELSAIQKSAIQEEPA